MVGNTIELSLNACAHEVPLRGGTGRNLLLLVFERCRVSQILLLKLGCASSMPVRFGHRVDAGLAAHDDAQAMLAREVVGRYRGLH